MLSVYEKLEIGLAGRLFHHQRIEPRLSSWPKALELAHNLVETFCDLVPKTKGYSTEEEYKALVFRKGFKSEGLTEDDISLVEYLVLCWLCRRKDKTGRPTEAIDLEKVFSLAEKVVRTLVTVCNLD